MKKIFLLASTFYCITLSFSAVQASEAQIALATHRPWAKTTTIERDHSFHQVQFHPKNTALVGVIVAGVFKVINTQQNKDLITVKKQEDFGCTSFDFHPNGKIVALATMRGKTHIFDWENKNEITTLGEYSMNPIFSTVFNSTGTQVATGGSDHKIVIWNTESWRQLNSFNESPKDIRSLAFHSTEEDIMLSIALDEEEEKFDSDLEQSDNETEFRSSLKIWNTKRGDCLVNIEDEEMRFQEGQFAPNGKEIILRTFNNGVHIFDPYNNKQETKVLAASEAECCINSYAISPNGKTVITAGKGDRSLTVWNLETQEILESLQAHTQFIPSLAFSPDGSKLASSSFDTKLIIWEQQNNKEEAKENSKAKRARIE